MSYCITNLATVERVSLHCAPSSPPQDMQCQLKPPCLHLYSINGALIIEKDLSECLNTMVIVDGYLITGNNRGFLTFRDLFRLVGESTQTPLTTNPRKCGLVVRQFVYGSNTVIGVVQFVYGRNNARAPAEM